MTRSESEPDLERRALLPAGLRDILPPDAAHEAGTIGTLIACCERHGYGRVKPPIVEFEDSLFSGPGVSMGERAFRVMDPVSRRMMGIRADMTVQVARIAATRLGHWPRPLRLCYSGEILRVMPDELNPERELVQTGAELIGADTVEADIEVIQLAIESLRDVGVRAISVDITTPRLVPELLRDLEVDPDNAAPLRAALDRKDPVAVARACSSSADVLTRLMAAAGERRSGIEQLRQVQLPESVQAIVDRLDTVSSRIAAADDAVSVTIDPVENRGFEYYTGLGFSLFSGGIRGELGRGGRYLVGGPGSEGSCGYTLYMETVLRAVQPSGQQQRIFVPFGTPRPAASALRQDNWITVAGLETVVDPVAEATRLGCTHVLVDGAPVSCHDAPFRALKET